MNRTSCIMLLLLLSLSAAGCALDSAPAQAHITIAEFGEVFIYAPLYVAHERGYFQQHGLNVTIVNAGGTDKVFAALLSGDAQFGIADPMIAVISGERGRPGTVVAGMLNGVPYWGVAKDPALSMLDSPSRLAGVTVGTAPSPSTAYTLQTRMFQEAGLEPDIRQLTTGAGLAALERGDIDVALELEPTVSMAVADGYVVAYSLSEQYPDFALTGVMALPEYVEGNPETVQAMVDALQDALTHIREHPDDAADILAERFPQVDRAVARAAVARLIDQGVFPANTTVSRTGWDIAAGIRKEVGHITADAPYEAYVAEGFSREAMR